MGRLHDLPMRLGQTLERKLSLGVAAGLVAFAVVAGSVTAIFAYHYQSAAALDLQAQLVATVRAQAEVAVYASNEDIAKGVIEGLLANPLIAAVRIRSTHGSNALANSGAPDVFGDEDDLTSYALHSPVDHATLTGYIDVVLDRSRVTEQVLRSTRLLMAVIVLQVALAAGLIVWASRRIIIAPITALARRMTEITPGSSDRLSIPDEHLDDEIGQLSRSANALIDAHDKVLNELHELATVDTLTGTYNRRYLMLRMEAELARLQRNETLRATVLMVDIDHFKVVNDTWGHAAGDTALSHLGIILRSHARKIDTVGRLGGEEFAILLVDTDPDEAMIFSERLRQTVADTPVSHDGKLINMTLSIGIATMSTLDTDAGEALERADTALYQAKQQGRNRVIMST